MRMLYPQVSKAQLDHLRDEWFSCWLREYVCNVVANVFTSLTNYFPNGRSTTSDFLSLGFG